MVMTGMSGREFAQKIRAARPNIRVVFMSGYAEEISAPKDQLDGPLLMKPFTRRPLLDLVAATLQEMAASF